MPSIIALLNHACSSTRCRSLQLGLVTFACSISGLVAGNTDDSLQNSAHNQFELLATAYQNDLGELTNAISQIYVSESSNPRIQNVLQTRGLGAALNSAHYQAPLTVSINGHTRNALAIQFVDWVDIDGVTLTTPSQLTPGANGVAGNLSLNTNLPEINKNQATAIASVGNYGSRRINGVWNYGFADSFSAMRIAASYREANGSVNNAFDTSNTQSQNNNFERFAVRGQYLLEPNENVRFHLNADYANTQENCCAIGFLRDSESLRYETPSFNTSGNYFDAVGLDSDGGVRESGKKSFEQRRSNTSLNRVDVESSNYSLNSLFKFSDLVLSYSPSYQELDFNHGSDLDHSNLDSITVIDVNTTDASGEQLHQTSVSHKISLSNDQSEKLFWEIGALYSKDKSTRNLTTTLGSDYQQYQSANTLYHLERLAQQAIDDGLFVDTASFYADFGSAYPNLNPVAIADNNIVLSATNTAGGNISAENNFASNQFQTDSSTTALYLKNIYKATDRLTLDWTIGATATRTKSSFEQLASDASACSATLNNNELNNLFTESENALNSDELSNRYANVFYTLQAAACPSSIIDVTDSNSQAIGSEFSAFQKSSAWNANLGATLSLSEQTITWVRAASWTKAGGVNQHPSAVSIDTEEYTQERHNIYEIGLQTTLKNSLNTSAKLTLFHHDITDLQIDAPLTSSARTIRWQGNIINLENAISSGFTFELNSKLYKGLTGSLNYSYVDARSASNCLKNANILNTYSRNDLCKKRITQAPESQAILTLSYSQRWDKNIEWHLRSNFSYESEQELKDFFGFSSEESLTLDATLKTNLYFTINNINHENLNWRLQVYGINLTDEQAARSISNVNSRPDAVTAYFDQSKQYGLSLELSL